MRRWQLWALSGPVAGGVTLGVLAPLLFLFDEVRVSGGLDSTALAITPWVALIAAVYGAVGGGIVGVIGAAAVAWLDRRRPCRSWTVDVRIASVAAGLAAVAIGCVNVFDGIEVGLWDVVIWILGPTFVIAAVAGVVAAVIFHVCGSGSAVPRRRVEV